MRKKGKRNKEVVTRIFLYQEFIYTLIVVSTIGFELTWYTMGQEQSSIPLYEADTLKDLYESLSGETWHRRDGWKQPNVIPAMWTGISVVMGHVIAIELPRNNLKGSIPPSIGKLTHLRVLDLSKNTIHGKIPETIGQCSELIKLDLSCNELSDSIPQTLCDCRRLQELHLFENYLSGSIPHNINHLKDLVTFQIQHNNISGAFPDNLCELTKLSKLNLRGNCMSGGLPETIGSLTSLVFLSLRNNNFTGPIPASIGMCRALEFLNLSSNHFSRTIPNSLAQLEDLEYLYLFDNQLEGHVPPRIARLKHLRESDFRNNRLVGELPNFLDGCSSLGVVLSKWRASHPHFVMENHVIDARVNSYTNKRLSIPISYRKSDCQFSPKLDSETSSFVEQNFALPQQSKIKFKTAPVYDILHSLDQEPQHSSAMLLHPTIDQPPNSSVEEDLDRNGLSNLVNEFSRKHSHIPQKYIDSYNISNKYQSRHLHFSTK